MLKQLIKTILVLIITGFGFTLNAQDVAWATAMGGKDADGSFGICTDPSGNSISIGLFKDTLNVSLKDGTSQRFVSNGKSDIIVKKQNTKGELLWVKAYGSPGDEFANAITSDDEGNVYFTGMFYEDIDFNPNGPNGALRVSGIADLYVCKLTNDGNFVWAKRIGGTTMITGYAIKVDKHKNVYVSGDFMGTVTFKPGDPSTTKASNITQDIFILKLDSVANYMWAHTFGSINAMMPDRAQGLDVDDDGNVYVTGFFYSDIDFDPGAGTNVLTSAAQFSPDMFVAKYDTDGRHIWAFNIGSGKGPITAYGLTLDGLGNIYICGDFQTETDFNPGAGLNTLTPHANKSWDGFVLKIDTAKNFKWATHLGGTLGDIAYAIASDRVGNVYVTGHVGSTGFINGTDTLNRFGRVDLFLSKLAAEDGKTMWVNVWGGINEEGGKSIALDQSGNAFVTGYFESTIKFNINGKIDSLNAIAKKDILDFKVICNDTSSFTIADTSCEDYIINGETFTQSGLYTQILANRSGCDSVLTLNLSIIRDLDVHINIDGFKLGTTNDYNSYQWLLNDQPISGETNKFFNVTENGFYRVVVTNERGCIDTSAAYEVNNVTSIQDVNTNHKISIYPNPTNNTIFIKNSQPLNIIVKSMDGKTLMNAENSTSISLGNLSAGIYFVSFYNKNGELLGTEKVIKN